MAEDSCSQGPSLQMLGGAAANPCGCSGESSGESGGAETICQPGPRGAEGKTGPRGANGTDGRQTLAYLGAEFTMPSPGGSVALAFDASKPGGNYWLVNGLIIYVEGAGYMIVSDAITNTVQNTGYAGNATPGSVIALGGLIIPAAPRGADAPAESRGYILMEERTTAGVNGGNFQNAAYRARKLNTIVQDTQGNVVSLDPVTGIFTLKGGRTYEFTAMAPAYDVLRHKARVRNTASSETFLGTSEYSSAGGGQTYSQIEGRFTIAVDTAFQLEHRCQTTQNNNGMGMASNFTGTGADFEKFSSIELWAVPS